LQRQSEVTTKCRIAEKKQHKNLEVRIIQHNFADEIKQETICKQANTY
jgi:hypothetical protein